MVSKFKFELDEKVEIKASAEQALIIAKAEYTTDENRYFLRYKNATGVAVEQWWSESALT